MPSALAIVHRHALGLAVAAALLAAACEPHVRSVRSESFSGEIKRIYVIIDNGSIPAEYATDIAAGLREHLKTHFASRGIAADFQEARLVTDALALEEPERIHYELIEAFHPDAVLTVYASALYYDLDAFSRADYKARIDVATDRQPIWVAEITPGGRPSSGIPAQKTGMRIADVIVARLDQDKILTPP